MKRLLRFLIMFLIVSLVFVPSVFAIDSNGETQLNSEVASIAGASRLSEDFEGESFSKQNRLTPDIVGTEIASGSIPSGTPANSLKFGHYRSMCSVDGINTFGEWRFHQADEVTINGNEDAYIALGERSYSLTDLSYQVLEFDITTMTTFPSNVWIFSEWRDSTGTGRVRVKFGSYNDEDGLWYFGDKTLKIEKNSWVHITIVFEIHETSGEGTLDYSTSVARVFADGEFLCDVYPYSTAVISSDRYLRQHYLGVGWPYGKAGHRTGMDENASVALDNVVLTRMDKTTYDGALSDVFSSDFTNLDAYEGKEIVFSTSYTYPSAQMALATVSVGSNTFSFGTLEEAVAYVKGAGLSDATVKLYADQYNSIEITSPMTLDLNGHQLLGGATTSTDVILSSTSGDLWYFADIASKYATFDFYQSPYAERGEAVATYMLSEGDELPTSIAPEVYVDSATGARYEPIGNWILYDEDGNIVEGGIETVSGANIGKRYSLCPEYTDPSVYFTIIKADGTMTHYDDPTALKSDNIPEGCTIVLKKDTPYSNSVTGTDYSFDFNGYALYQKDGLKYATFGGAGTIYIYSSRPGGAVYTGTYALVSGSTTYSYQAALVLADGNATAGTTYNFGFRSEGVASDYRLTVYCGSFGQLGSANNVKAHLNGVDIIAGAGDNKGIFTTRNGRQDRTWQIDNCTILIANSKPLCSHVSVGANVATYVFNNTNIYGNGALFGVEGALTASPTITFNQTNIYGKHNINAGDATYTDSEGVVYNYTKTLVVNGKCYLNDLPAGGVVLPDGYMLIPDVTASATNIYTFPYKGRYDCLATGDVDYLGGSYMCAGYIAEASEYSTLVLQSVAIDTSVNVLFYLPESASVVGAFLGDTNLLDTTKVQVIGGDDYFVVRVSVLPKEAYQSRTVTLKFNSTEVTLELDASLLHYAEKLMAISDTSSSGTYYADSQSLMKYVLYYVRTASTSLGGVSASELSELDTLLDGFELTSADKALAEDVYTTSSVSGMLTAATLDLRSKVGMVFQVAEGFVGEVRADMPHVRSVVKTYTEDAAAGSEEYIVLSNIPAYALCEDVTVTLTPTSGSAVVFTYNLATYVNGTKADISYAVYAYAKAALEYRESYPQASVFGDE